MIDDVGNFEGEVNCCCCCCCDGGSCDDKMNADRTSDRFFPIKDDDKSMSILLLSLNPSDASNRELCMTRANSWDGVRWRCDRSRIDGDDNDDDDARTTVTPKPNRIDVVVNDTRRKFLVKVVAVVVVVVVVRRRRGRCRWIIILMLF